MVFSIIFWILGSIAIAVLLLVSIAKNNGIYFVLGTVVVVLFLILGFWLDNPESASSKDYVGGDSWGYVSENYDSFNKWQKDYYSK